MPNIYLPRRKSPLQDLYTLPSQATAGLDIQPLPPPQMMPLPPVPEMETNYDGLANLSRMGTERALGLGKKKKTTVPTAETAESTPELFEALKSFIFM